MSGKRILDILALAKVSRIVAKKHFDIRVSQLQLYNKTSSVSKLFSSQFGLNIASSNSFSQSASRTSKPTREGIGQDHFYERSEANSVDESPANQDLDISQSKAGRRPLPDGTIPPKDSPIGFEGGDPESFSQRPTAESPQHPLQSQEHELNVESSKAANILGSDNSKILSSNEAKVLQRQYEDPIPAKTADPPGKEADVLGEEFEIEQERDIFSQPPNAVSPVLSSLPRVRVPKIENDIQAKDPHLKDDLNADVYYSGTKDANPKGDTGELSEEQLGQLFHSPRIARMLGNKSNIPNPGKGSRTFHTLRTLQQAGQTERESIKELAKDIAKDAEIISTGEKSGLRQYQMRESKVPSSRFERLFEYGGLAASMAFGAVSESMNRSKDPNGSLMLSPANIQRLVTKLSKMRGAALKLGQMISFQDSRMLPQPIHEVLQRVQDSADYMPISQRNSVIAADLGPGWEDLFLQFDEKPMAAASIGQVHGAVLKSNGQRVAVKVQYPGVAQSISSDLNNLSLLLTASRLLPKGLYLDKTIANARTELAWECDYIREAEGAKRFKELLADEPDVFTVPTIIDEASGKQVLTMERMEGIAVTKIRDISQEQKDWIGTQILRLCLREITEFRYMQTDPNWTNFLFNKQTNKLELLDFGASREFPEKFIALYTRVLEAASRKDRKACEDFSIQLGYLTGYESKLMLNAHIDSVLTLAEPFMADAPDVYDFKDQTITDRVRALIPVMIKERLAPPPEETYSLHRKLSGAFLLCARLESRVRCKDIFQAGLEKAGLR